MRDQRAARRSLCRMIAFISCGSVAVIALEESRAAGRNDAFLIREVMCRRGFRSRGSVIASIFIFCC